MQELIRTDGEVRVRIRGHSNTHVLFDMQHAGKDKRWHRFQSRPILPFMLDYGLLG